MAQLKSDLSIAIRIGEKLPNNQFLVKRGRLKSEKLPYATLTEIFDTARKYAVKCL